MAIRFLQTRVRTRTTARAGRAAVALGACLLMLLTVGAGSALAAWGAKVQAGTLEITGDAGNSRLALRLDPSDPSQLQVDVGENGTADFSFPLASFDAINVQAGAGNDEFRVDQAFGSFADKSLTVNGGPGNDRLFGGDGNDQLIGGDGNDFVDGERGNDVVLLGTGNDTFNWNPGDGSDTVEGGSGTLDTLDFNGSNVGENYDISANGNRVRFFRDVGNVTMDLHRIDRVHLETLGGADNVNVGNLTGTGLRTVTVDLAAFGSGDGAADTVTALGTSGPDHVRLTHSSAGVAVVGLYARTTVGGAEAANDSVDVDTLGGNDTLTSGVGISGPAVVGFDGGAGTDTASYSGSAADDNIFIASNGSAALTFASGASTLQTTAAENLTVAGGDGNDSITAGNGLASLTNLTIYGGNGDDMLTGGDGNDRVSGGPGNDTVAGGRGNDLALLGDGDDTFVWNPGDGSDTAEGQNGSDTFLFDGANVAENVSLSRNGDRVRFTRDVGNVVLDLHGIETAHLEMRGGADHAALNDLTGTDLQNVGVDLSGSPAGGGDGQPDTVTVNGTARPDHVLVTTVGSSDVLVDGLFAGVDIVGSEPTADTLAVNTLGGIDSVAVDPGVSGLINPVVDLGPQ